jgi:hypothetical protein
MQILRPGGTNRELLVEALEELRQEDVASSHFADIVDVVTPSPSGPKRTGDSFHAALGLAGVRADDFDVQPG